MRSAEEIAELIAREGTDVLLIDAAGNQVDLTEAERDLVVAALRQAERTPTEHALERIASALETGLGAPATDVEAIQAETGPTPIALWAEIELMGHRRVIGSLEEVQVAGRPMLYVRRLQKANRQAGLGEPHPPLELEHPGRTYSTSALFSFAPLDEDAARQRVLERGLGEPVYDHDDDEIPF